MLRLSLLFTWLRVFSLQFCKLGHSAILSMFSSSFQSLERWELAEMQLIYRGISHQDSSDLTEK